MDNNGEWNHTELLVDVEGTYCRKQLQRCLLHLGFEGWIDCESSELSFSSNRQCGTWACSNKH